MDYDEDGWRWVSVREFVAQLLTAVLIVAALGVATVLTIAWGTPQP